VLVIQKLGTYISSYKNLKMKHIKLFEEFLDDSFGNKTKKFIKYINKQDAYWDWFNDADDNRMIGGLPNKYHQTVKSLGVKPENAIIIFDDSVESWSDTLNKLNSFGIKYAEIDDDGQMSLVFDGTK